MLLAFATLLMWIPVIELLGLAIGAIAVVLILLGAPAFGLRHTQLVWAALLLFVAAQVVLLGLVTSFSATITGLSSGASGPATTAQVLAAFDTLFYGSLVLVSIMSLCSALIAFDLEDVPGRILLAAGVAAQIVISVSLFVFVLIPLVHQAIQEAFASTPPNMSVITAADQQVRSLSGLAILNSIPACFFAGAYAWAYHRISRGATPSPGKTLPYTSRTLLAAIIALIVIASAAEAAALGSGILSITPRPPPAWHTVTSFSGDGPGTTENFTISGREFRFGLSVTDNGPGGYSFNFKTYRAGTATEVGSCGSGSTGPGSDSGGCEGFAGPGSYYLAVTDATGVDSWLITVSELV